jgi:sugar lactone lactonase YvrE
MPPTPSTTKRRAVRRLSCSSETRTTHRYSADAAPNGIALSPDESTLYIGKTSAEVTLSFDDVGIGLDLKVVQSFLVGASSERSDGFGLLLRQRFGGAQGEETRQARLA